MVTALLAHTLYVSMPMQWTAYTHLEIVIFLPVDIVCLLCVIQKKNVHLCAHYMQQCLQQKQAPTVDSEI